MTIETIPFDATKYFTDAASQAELITEALESGDAGFIAAAIGVVARARGMSEVAEEAGLSRQSLHKALSDRGNPTLDTLMKVLDVLGLQLVAKAREAA